MLSDDSPSGTNLNHWMLHIFIEHISCKNCLDCFVVLHLNHMKGKTHTHTHTLQTIAKFVL